jgi:hypothetical protein
MSQQNVFNLGFNEDCKLRSDIFYLLHLESYCENKVKYNFCEVRWLLFKHSPEGAYFSNLITLRKEIARPQFFTFSISKWHLDLALLSIDHLAKNPASFHILASFAWRRGQSLCTQTCFYTPASLCRTCVNSWLKGKQARPFIWQQTFEFII